MKSLVSICVPTYKRAHFAAECLASCLIQDHDDIEIHVHDSTPDASVENVVRSFNSARLFYHKHDVTVTLVPKLNEFLKIARGDYAVVVCDDDLISSPFVGTLVRRFLADERVSLAKCRYRLIDGAGDLVALDAHCAPVAEPDEFISDLFSTPVPRFKVNLTGVMFRTQALKDIGGFIPQYQGLHTDRLAWAELALSGLVVTDPNPLCSIRLHEGSLAHSSSADLDSSLEADRLAYEHMNRLLGEIGPRANIVNEINSSRLTGQRIEQMYKSFLARTFDRGFSGALLLQDHQMHLALNHLFKRMEEYRVASFYSYYIYRVLAPLPGPLRRPIVRIFSSLRNKYGIRKSRYLLKNKAWAPGERAI